MTRFFMHHNIQFQKKHRIKVLLQLAYNLALFQLWRIKKRIRSIHRPVVHLYAVCWNEEKIIPFFLQHYNGFVDHYYIYDNYSDDATDTLLAAQSNITVRKYDTGDTFNDIVHQQIKNSAWKQSRGKADWVIVIDMDEFLYHPQMEQFLTQNSRITLFKPQGFNMVTNTFPLNDKKLIESVNKGVQNDYYSKSVLFNPHKIINTNYEPGAHDIYPEGIISILSDPTFKLLHYKNLGIDYVLNRFKLYKERISKINKEQHLALHYETHTKQIVKEITRDIENATLVVKE